MPTSARWRSSALLACPRGRPAVPVGRSTASRAGLTGLDLGDLAVDPFTGQPLKYEVLGATRYRLSSAGPKALADDPQAVDGRRPVSVGPE